MSFLKFHSSWHVSINFQSNIGSLSPGLPNLVLCVMVWLFWLDYLPILLPLRQSVTGMEFGLRKRRRGLDASIVTTDSRIDAGRYTDELQCFWCACTVVFLPEDQSRQLWCHEMTSQWSLVLFWKGTIKGEHTQTLGLSSGFSDTEQLGLLTSHRPSTPAILVPLMEQSITRMNCVFHLSICMYPDIFGNF